MSARSVEVVTSNGVVDLAPDNPQVFAVSLEPHSDRMRDDRAVAMGVPIVRRT